VDVTLALLADGANLSREGKLNILGVFDTIFARTLPTTHPQMQLVLRFEADSEDLGKTRNVEVQFVTPDGGVPFRVPIALATPAMRTEPVRIDQVVSLTNVQLAAAGRHRFHVLIDGELAMVVPLNVEQIAASH
jgi:hypothetical protein